MQDIHENPGVRSRYSGQPLEKRRTLIEEKVFDNTGHLNRIKL